MKKSTIIVLALLMGSTTIHAKVWHVDANKGSVKNAGTAEAPVKTISTAASHALAGDTILIKGGTYREWVSPANAGFSEKLPIVYKAAEGEQVLLKGSEQIKNWKKDRKRNCWVAVVDNMLFGDFNPFNINLFGDWLNVGGQLHLGEVYLNNVALKEVEKIENMEENAWFAVVEDEQTLIYANFGTQNPNKELTEINVRPTCFFPKTTGINYINVENIHISQAATQWSAPTTEQVGIIGPNWSKGWVIKGCEISHSKCVGICIGKERATGHNLWTLYEGKYGYTKHGFNREIESIIAAYDLGWSKEYIGSHTIENNNIHHCGQAGIVGHLGCVFSTIQNNEIHDINTNCKPRFHGWESAGIKLHAAIDVKLSGNVIRNTSMGVWLDWQAQGTHVFNNIIAESEQQDLFLEVSHGPTLVYNNVLLSKVGLRIDAQGIVFANNTIAGIVNLFVSQARYTPYHKKNSTKLKGLFNNTGGDVRFYNNVFVCNYPNEKGTSGLDCYNAYPVYTENMNEKLNWVSDYLNVKLPVWAEGNCYYQGAKPYKNETNATQIDSKAQQISLSKEGNTYKLNNLPTSDDLKNVKTVGVNTDMLGMTMISELHFENIDGTSFVLDKDFYGNKRNSDSPTAGAVELP